MGKLGQIYTTKNTYRSEPPTLASNRGHSKTLGLRIVRVCSYPVDRDKRLEELKEQLIERGYNQDMIQSIIDKVRKIPQNLALKRV